LAVRIVSAKARWTTFKDGFFCTEHKMKNFLRDETGLELSEYAVAAALVAIAVVAAFTALGTAISDKITSLGTTISK
jgi:pilus assembly protein Flp/PilA